jgi:hypothetical protein
MRHLLLVAAVAAASLWSGTATAAEGFSGVPLDPSRVDSRDLIRHTDEKPAPGALPDPQDYRRLSDRELAQRANQLAAQEQQIRAAQQAVADETARRANR